MARRSTALRITQGDYYVHTVTVTDSEGDPIDCSAWTVTSQLRATAKAVEPLAEFDVDDTDAATGVFVLTLDEDVTAELPDGTATTDVQRVLAGKPTTFLTSSVLVVADVTRG